MRSTLPIGSPLADLAKQRDLPIRRPLPVEALRIGAGHGARGQGSQQVADCRGEAVGGGLVDDPSGLVGSDDISDAIDVGGDYRGPQAMLSSSTFGQPSCVETSSSRSAAL